MKTAIFQVSVLIDSLIHLWLHASIPGVQASHHEHCGNKLQHEPWDHTFFNLTYLHTPLPDSRMFHHNEKDACPSFHSFFRRDHLSAQYLSLCPWSYIRHYDPNRFPSEMFYARCSCKKCGSWDIHGMKHECRAHYHAFNVVRRVCTNGQYMQYHSHEYLPIACVCSHEQLRLVGSFG